MEDQRAVARMIVDDVRVAACADFVQVVRVAPDGSTRTLASVGTPYARPRDPLGAVDPGVFVLPLRVGDRRVGVVTVGREPGRPIAPAARTVLSLLAPWYAVALDATRRFDEATRRRVAVEAEQATALQNMRAQWEFIAGASHELRSPLASIVAYLRAITDGICEGPEEQQTFIEHASVAANDLMMLLEDVLDTARIETGTIEFRPEPVDIQPILEDVERLFMVQAREKGLALRFDADEPDSTTVMADPARLKQVLVNLVSNAVKFTDTGSVTVRARSRPAAGFMTIEVVDTGCGIPRADQSRVFQKFVRATSHMSRHYAGTGLGLTIVKFLVEMMGGVIALDSPGEGLGTHVMLSLPLAAPTPLVAPDEAAADSFDGPTGGELVGVVDDDPDMRDIVCELLHRSGYRTVAAATADEALATLLRTRPRLVVMDIALSCPASAVLHTGVDVAIALADQLGPKSPTVLFMTGATAVAPRLLADLPDTLRAEVLAKPVDLAVLRAKVHAGLDAAAARPA